jgi:aromatic ring hydroxylase
VFLKGEWRYAGPLALTFVEFHRFTAISYKLQLVDLLVGSARLIAYAETLRALIRQAALGTGSCRPSTGCAS